MTITTFFGPHRFLSNFYYTDLPIVCDMGISYPSVEHAYQAHKTLDINERKQIALLPSASASKKYSHTMTVREDWKSVRMGIMENLLRQKFSQPSFKRRLLETGNQELIEGNTWHDTFWGVCNGVGSNNLGKLLMMIREEHKKTDFLDTLFDI
jgi:ribA/ribD-fused uncharacterized protein